MFSLRKTITVILLVVFVIGLCLVLYPAVSQYYNSRVQSKTISEYSKLAENTSEDLLNETIEKADNYNEALSALVSPFTDYNSVPDYDNTLNTDNNGMMGFVSIERIKVELPIYHGISSDVLSKACGHVPGSSLPVGGEGTHSVLSAHRGLPSSKLFTDLDKMEIGDVFSITVLNKTIWYEVDQIKVVEPNDSSSLQIIPGEDLVTLVTCTPYGINSHRLLVRGHRTDSKARSFSNITSEAYIVDRIIVTPIVALPILLVLILYVVFKPAKKKGYNR